VLVVDDEPVVRDVLTRYLEHEGFCVDAAADGEQALRALGERTPSVVVLDLMLPKIGGLEVLLRRANGGARRPLAFGELVIDPQRREVLRSGEPVHTTRKEFELLLLLASHPGRAFTRAQLVESVWGYVWTGDTDTVTVHVRRLRAKIEDDPANPRRIRTVHGVGYRFEP
jgi:DNA-binding response OmpR family regulator